MSSDIIVTVTRKYMGEVHILDLQNVCVAS